MAELRKHLGKSLQFKVAKNTLARKAAEGTPISVASGEFKGQVGLAIGYDDPVLLVKKIIEYSKKNEKLGLGAGVIEGRLVSAGDLKRIAELPPKPVLLSMLAGVMQAPLSKLAGGLAQTVGKFGHALHALKSKKEAAAGA